MYIYTCTMYMYVPLYCERLSRCPAPGKRGWRREELSASPVPGPSGLQTDTHTHTHSDTVMAELHVHVGGFITRPELKPPPHHNFPRTLSETAGTSYIHSISLKSSDFHAIDSSYTYMYMYVHCVWHFHFGWCHRYNDYFYQCVYMYMYNVYVYVYVYV